MNAVLYRVRTLDQGMPRHIAEDNGCDVSSRCIACPLSACKHDDLRPYRTWKKGLIANDAPPTVGP